VPGLYIVTSAWVLLFMIGLRPVQSAYGLATIALGAALHRWVLRRR